MRTTSIYLLSGLVLLVGLSACAKSTKRKVANEWKVTSFTEQGSSVSDGDKTTSTRTITESTITSSTLYEPAAGPSYTTEESGVVKLNDFTINTDGTWSTIQEFVYSYSGGVTTEVHIERSGTWSFLAKTKGDDFKKNERILFNVLKMNSISVQKTNGIVTDQESSGTVNLTGKETEVYTVTKSKKDQLELEMESHNTFNDEQSVKTSRKMVLGEK